MNRFHVHIRMCFLVCETEDYHRPSSKKVDIHSFVNCNMMENNWPNT